MNNVRNITKKVQAMRTGRHCVFNLHVHLVFVTKYRQKVFTKQHLDLMSNVFTEICVDFQAELIEFDGEVDHVHLLVNYPPQTQISKMINSLKGVSSRMLKKHYPEIIKWYYKNQALWSPSYFAASCGGAPIAIVRQYIEQQKTPD
jgi:REP-associated tyrosine transposase